MKKVKLFLSMILILIIGTTANAQTVDDMISKATAAMGGQSAIDAIKSIKMDISGTYMGKEVEMEVAILKPDNKFIRMNITSLNVDGISATNGTDYWTSQNGQVMDMPLSAKEQFWSSFHLYSGTGASELIGNGTFTYSGKENINGINADVVKGIMTGSGAVSIYFDEAGLPFKILMPTESGDLHMYMSNYRNVGGMLIAYKYEQIVNGSTQMVLEITNVEANIDIDPSTFDRPTE